MSSPSAFDSAAHSSTHAAFIVGPSDTDVSRSNDQAVAENCVPARLDADVLSLMCCPRCQGKITWLETQGVCRSAECGLRFPIADGAPVIVDAARSVFDVETFLRAEPTFFRPVSKWRGVLTKLIPDVSRNVAAERVYAELKRRLLARAENRVVNVLVVGGGVTGSGMDCLLDEPRIRLIETDAAVAPRTQLICDAHDLPFQDGSMDAVIVQAVLEHVVDPHRCVDEIHRVLAPEGLVYSDTPFMQQVHGRQFDFTRFTRLGHRRLFRRFDEIDAGITCGPGMALAWSFRYFLMSLSDNRKFRAGASAFARFTSWWLNRLDPWLCRHEAAFDAASAFYFLGQRSDETLQDKALLASYRGGQ